EVLALVTAAVGRARAAQQSIEGWDQQQADDAVTAIAFAATRPDVVQMLADLAAEQSGLGNAADKATKIMRKTLGTMSDLKGAPSVGVIDIDEARGVTTIAKPMGVIACILPSTNPGATPINNMMITLKGRNAVILAPHPRGEATCAESVRIARAELAKLGAPEDLVQLVSVAGADKEAGKAIAAELLSQVDYSLVTAGPANVDMAYRVGTPSHGVGVGNAPVIIDETADLDAAIPKIVASKTFDHATSCSSENSLVIHDSVYDSVMVKLQDQGGWLVPAEKKEQLQQAMWPGGNLNRQVVAQPASRIAEVAGLDDEQAHAAKFLIVEESGIGEAHPFSGEKLSVVLTVYRASDFEHALDTVEEILSFMGEGHSCGIHSEVDERVERLAERARVSTVLVNQPHAYNNGGSFDNGLDFTLSMGAGTWGDNDTCENLTYKHFLNYTYLARPIPSTEPTEDELFGDFLARSGRRVGTAEPQNSDSSTEAMRTSNNRAG
ncbi:MAG: sulfoacetaldehyde dehydrogenase, partial [Thermoproteota archaeon]